MSPIKVMTLAAARQIGPSLIDIDVARHMMRAALEAAKAAGWQLVPVEPTEVMADAGVDDYVGGLGRCVTPGDAANTWGAMIAAAPDPTRDAG